MVPSITDVWGYDREFCSSSSSPSFSSSSTRCHGEDVIYTDFNLHVDHLLQVVNK